MHFCNFPNVLILVTDKPAYWQLLFNFEGAVSVNIGVTESSIGEALNWEVLVEVDEDIIVLSIIVAVLFTRSVFHFL